MEWSQEKVVQFIDAYRIREILWDPSNKQYYNKTLKNDAWNEISQELDISVEVLKKKMDNLLGQFRREKAKIKKTTGQGADEAYKPTWYAYESMRFLLERNKPRHRINTEELDGNSTTEEVQNEQSQNEQDQNEQDKNEQDKNEQDKDEQDQNEQTQNAESQTIGEKRPNFENESPQSSNNNKNKSGKVIFKPPLPKKKKAKDSDTQMMNSALEMLSSAATAAKEVSARNVAASSNADESQIYANYIASKFRLYSQRTKNALQHKISNLLFQADNGVFDYQSSYGYSREQQPRAYSTQQRTPVQSSPSSVMSEASYTESENSDFIENNDTQDSFSDLFNL